MKVSNSRRWILCGFGLVSLFGGIGYCLAQTAGEVTALEGQIESYEKRCEELQQPLADLDQAYLKRLKVLKELAQKQGSLDHALAVVKAIEALEEGKSPTVEVEFSELQQARATYETERQRREGDVKLELRAAYTRHITNLEDAVVELTKQDEIEAAVEIKTYLDSLPDEPTPAVLVAPTVASNGREIELFWAPNFEGESVKLSVPVLIDRFAYDKRLKNDKLRSIRIPVGVTVTLSNVAALSSGTTVLTEDTAEVAKGVSSIKAE